MDMEQQVVEALVAELQRQAEGPESRLEVGTPEAGALTVNGVVNLEELAMALVGAVAGGP
jgi:hypothetical protein